MLGEPELKHRLKRCPRCARVYPCEKLDTVLPPGGTYAYDVIAEVGRARSLEYLQAHEIQARMVSGFQLQIPKSTVPYLVIRFLIAIGTVQEAYAPSLKEWFRRKHGGYVLHLDGTCEGGTRVIFIAVDGESNLTLFSLKIRSEGPEDVKRFLRKCIRLFGRPLATVRDLSKNIQAARNEVLKNVPDFICEYHLLLNIGKRLCKGPRQALDQRLRHHGIRTWLTSARSRLMSRAKALPPISQDAYEAFLKDPTEHLDANPTQLRRLLVFTLIKWIEDYAVELNGEYFPFDQPELLFYKRCRELYDWLDKLLKSCKFTGNDRRVLENLRHTLAPTRKDPELVHAACQLQTASESFDEARHVFRLEKPNGGSVLRQHAPREFTVEELRERDRNLKKYRKQRDEVMRDASQPDRARHAKIIAGQFDKYRDGFLGRFLWPKGRKTPLVVSRTNYPAEHKFGRRKRGWRRQSGNKKLAKRLDACHEAELLVDNLWDQEYLDMVYDGSLDNMPKRFAEHWSDIVKGGLLDEEDENAEDAEDADNADSSGQARLHVRKQVLRLPNFLQMMDSAISSLAK